MRNLDILEHLVDEMGVEGVLNDLIEVCHLKADHLRVNWQDEDAALIMDKVASKIEMTRAEVWEFIK